jgi:VWFA-related protein
MSYPPQFPFARLWKCFSAVLLLAGLSTPVRGQTPASPAPPAAAAQTPAPAEPAKPQAPANDSAEVSSRDTAPTFKVRVNLVLVRVVVRDSQGKVVPNLKREDFQLTDNRKLQTISTFSVETPESHVVPTTTGADPNAPADPEAAKAVAAALPQRFVSVVFDDQHLTMQDALFVRTSAGRFFDSLAPSDRVGIYSTSGQFAQEFTDDHELLRKSLLKILPHSPTAGLHDCPDISYYQADLIQNKQDLQALAVATEDAVQCAFNGDETQRTAAQGMAQAMAGAVVGRRCILSSATWWTAPRKRMS